MCDDVPYPEFYREKVQMARKQYHCCECHKPINIGDKYTYIAGKWDGDFNSFRQCLSCNKLMELASLFLNQRICFTELRDMIRECELISFDKESDKWLVAPNVNFIEMDGNIPRIKQS
jgi:hypothetical protein